MGNLKKCRSCNTYTLADACPECGDDAVSPAPPAFSYPDTQGEYRRETKRRQRT